MTLRDLENSSIRAFVQSAADEGYLSGRVLDYGCGKQPYRDIVEAAGGEYVGFDLVSFPANASGEDVVPAGYDSSVEARDGSGTALHSYTREAGYFDAVICTQVVQYVPTHRKTRNDYWENALGELLMDMRILMDEGNETLVMTYPTNWPEVEPEDLHRFTKAGMERLLTEAGFTILRHERRGVIHAKEDPGEAFAIGYGVICRA